MIRILVWFLFRNRFWNKDLTVIYLRGLGNFSRGVRKRYREEEVVSKCVCYVSYIEVIWSLILQGLVCFTKYIIYFIQFNMLKYIMIYFFEGKLCKIYI